MPVSADYTDFLIEMLAPLGPVTSRRMFGGAGLFADGLMFGLIVDDVLYFKVDDENRAAFEEEGMEIFSYARSGKQASLSYWRVPERLFDDPDEFVDWARDAMSVALRADTAKPPSQRKKHSA